MPVKTIKTKAGKRKVEETNIKGKKILGTLTEEELRGINAAVATIQTKERELYLLRLGYNSMIKQIAEDYGLPDEYSVDMSTGKLGALGVF